MHSVEMWHSFFSKRFIFWNQPFSYFFSKLLLSRNFCEKSVSGENFRNFHTVLCIPFEKLVKLILKLLLFGLGIYEMLQCFWICIQTFCWSGCSVPQHSVEIGELYSHDFFAVKIAWNQLFYLVITPVFTNNFPGKRNVGFFHNVCLLFCI